MIKIERKALQYVEFMNYIERPDLNFHFKATECKDINGKNALWLELKIEDKDGVCFASKGDYISDFEKEKQAFNRIIRDLISHGALALYEYFVIDKNVTLIHTKDEEFNKLYNELVNKER